MTTPKGMRSRPPDAITVFSPVTGFHFDYESPMNGIARVNIHDVARLKPDAHALAERAGILRKCPERNFFAPLIGSSESYSRSGHLRRIPARSAGVASGFSGRHRVC